jgi:two-component system alkaline phosphatase synthesis response regulator PhoP
MKAFNRPSAGNPADRLTVSQPGFPQRILVVEEESNLRQFNAEVLTCSGYHVDAAEDGAVAWDALQLNNYGLVVTDNDMPKLTGVELIQKIQAAHMTLPVIMATGAFPEDELARRGLLHPAVTLLKPFTFDELLTAVKEVLRATGDALEELAPPPNWQFQPLADRFWL